MMNLLDVLRKRPVVILLVLLYVLHLLGIFGLVSHFEWGTGRPLLTDDYALRSAFFADARVLFQAHRLWGYSPYHLAGYPYGLFNFSAKGEQLLSLALPFVNSAELLKLYILIGIVTLPFLVMAAARVLERSPSSVAIAGMITILFFWKFPNVSSIRWGSISYITACALALLALTFLLLFLKGHRLGPLLLFCSLGSISVLVHSVALFLILPPASIALLCALKGNTKWVPLLGSLGLCVMIAVNLFWIFPFIRYRIMLNTTLLEPAFLEHISFQSWYFSEDSLRLLLLLFGFLGVVKWFHDKEPFAIPFAFGVVLLMSVMFIMQWPTVFLFQRFRYDWPLSLFLSLPASDFVAGGGWQFLLDRVRRDGRRVLAPPLRDASLVLFYGIVIVGIVTSDNARYHSYLMHLFVKEKAFDSSWPLPTSMRPPEMDQLLTWIQKNENKEGRLLMEDSHHPRHIYWGSHLPAILPRLTGREIVNSPLPEAPLPLITIGFTDGKLLGKPIEQFSETAFREYVNRYNIRWIICFSPVAKRYFNKLPSSYIREEVFISPFSCYDINRPSNFFLKGSGKVSADFNRISLKKVKAESEEVILKYHWFPGIRTVPERRVERDNRGGDPVGFIKIQNPPEEIEVIF